MNLAAYDLNFGIQNSSYGVTSSEGVNPTEFKRNSQFASLDKFKDFGARLKFAFLPVACLICGVRIRASDYPRYICRTCFANVHLRESESALDYLELNDYVDQFSFTNSFTDTTDTRDTKNSKNIMLCATANSSLVSAGQVLPDLPKQEIEEIQELEGMPRIPRIPLGIASFYENTARILVTRLKFHGFKESALTIGDILTIFYLRELRLAQFDKNIPLPLIPDIDFVIPVPLHVKRLQERGFNQAEEIAKVFGVNLGLNLLTDGLERIKYTKRQSETKTRSERLRNVENAFRYTGTIDLRAKNVLLIDDVVTSGQTLAQAALALIQVGAKVTALAFTSKRAV